MALWQSKPKVQVKTGNNTTPINFDGGLNNTNSAFHTSFNEALRSLNTDFSDGELRLQKAPKVLGPLTADTIKAVGVRDGKLVTCLHNGKWYKLDLYIDTEPFVIGEYTIQSDIPLTAEGTTIDFLVGGTLYTLLCTNEGVWAWDGGLVVTELTAPKTALYAVDDYRLYALKDNVLHISKMNSITEWEATIPLSSSKGDSKAIVRLEDKIYCFSEFSMHILYGDDVDNFVLSEVYDFGCISRKAITVYNGNIYFISSGKGIYAFNNSEGLRNVGTKIDKGLGAIKSESAGLYSLAIIKNILYVRYMLTTYILDLEKNIWSCSNKILGEFVNVYNTSYGQLLLTLSTNICAVNDSVYSIDSSDTTTEWFHETPFKMDGFNNFVVSKFIALVYLPTGSTMKLSYNTNPDYPFDWQDLYTFTADNKTSTVCIDVPMDKLNNVNMYQLKLSGTGYFRLHYLGIDERVILR